MASGEFSALRVELVPRGSCRREKGHETSRLHSTLGSVVKSPSRHSFARVFSKMCIKTAPSASFPSTSGSVKGTSASFPSIWGQDSPRFE